MNRIDKVSLTGMIILIIVLLFKPFDKPLLISGTRYKTEPVEVMAMSLEPIETYTNVTICSFNGFGYTKSWMPANAITDTSSKQYDLIYNSGLITLNSKGHYIYYDKELHREYLGIAISSIYGNVGDKFKVTLDNGIELYTIKLDSKASHEVDSCGSHPDGSVIEFVMEENLLYESYENFNGGLQMYEPFDGSIVSIERIEE